MAEELTQPLAREGGAFKLASRKIRVEVVDGPDRGLVVELPGPEARVGLGRECDLVLKDPTVSRLHLVVRVEGERIRVIDAGSRNGTAVDGVEVHDAYARPDAAIVVGGTTMRLRMLNDVIELPLSERERFGGMLGRSVAMRRLFAVLERVAATDATVLVEGETGTGKELVAEALHEESPRQGGPFVVFDCSAVSATLIESELFGHVRGAFTGAVSERPGAFEAADGGTLFLDEIGELPLDLQPKLLRALERREVRRVGANVPRRVDVRIVAATNRNLAREVERGKFREDLYYRLAVIQVALPPLRERQGDVPLLVRRFEEELRPRSGSPPPLSEEVVAALAARSWPGNVRELRNAVARALSLGTAGSAGGPPSPAAPSGGAQGAPAVDLNEPLLAGRERVAEAYEKAYLDAALKQTGGNVSRAAELARVNRKLIQRAMKRYGLRGDGEDAEVQGEAPRERS
ncbi:sigma 54-interacting transcriptional regulator [Sorangium cellulosum]|uniref:sigma 54-interacting transcriptional regulator n=1 Tax=Sorangium cellulosum TaxID=56 RepID=UPI001F2F2798|nr:sigma 54-interacting transcriptional regulator [Sorangium cellulosum]